MSDVGTSRTAKRSGFRPRAGDVRLSSTSTKRVAAGRTRARTSSLPELVARSDADGLPHRQLVLALGRELTAAAAQAVAGGRREHGAIAGIGLPRARLDGCATRRGFVANRAARRRGRSARRGAGARPGRVACPSSGRIARPRAGAHRGHRGDALAAAARGGLFDAGQVRWQGRAALGAGLLQTRVGGVEVAAHVASARDGRRAGGRGGAFRAAKARFAARVLAVQDLRAKPYT